MDMISNITFKATFQAVKKQAEGISALLVEQQKLTQKLCCSKILSQCPCCSPALRDKSTLQGC